MKAFRYILLVLAVLAGPAIAGLAGQEVRAQESGWTVTQQGTESTFSIARSDNSKAERVYYRTVGLSAFEGENYTLNWNVLNFAAGDWSKTVSITENSDIRESQFIYHNGAGHSYRIEVLDESFHTVLASCVRKIQNYDNYTFTSTYLHQSITDLVYIDNSDFASGLAAGKYYDEPLYGNQGAYFTVYDDDDYKKALVVSALPFIRSINTYDTVLQPYLDLIDIKLYATVCFTEKEVKDGYQYIQILADNTTEYDGKDGDGKVSTPSKSVYKGCFEGYKSGSSVYDIEYKWFFPHRYDYKNSGEGSESTSGREFFHAENYLYQQAFKPDTPGYRAANAGALVLSPETQDIVIRFDANGSGDDTWQYKDLFVRMALCDNTAPTLLNYDLAVTKYPYNNSPATITIPFSEIVVVSGTPTISTTWGTFTYEAGSGSNVLSFSGTIHAPAGTGLSVTGLTGTVTDMVGNAFTWSGTKNGGTVQARGTLEDLETDSQGRYLIQSKGDLYNLATYVNAGNDVTGKTFLQTADIPCDSGFVPVGDQSHPFRGTYDGGGRAISSINLSGGNYVGLFGNVGNHGTVRDVVLRSSTFTGNKNVGGIAGYGHLFSTISGCRVESSVSIQAGSNGAEYLGGIAGYIIEATIEGCYSAAMVTNNGFSSCQSFGGIVGIADSDWELATGFGYKVYPSTVRDCFYAGSTVTGGDSVGALVGEGPIVGISNKPTLDNNYYLNGSLPGGYKGTDVDGARRAWTVTLGPNVSLGNTRVSYSVSGLDGYSTVLRCNGTYYSGESQSVGLQYTGNVPTGYEVVFSVNSTPITGSSFTMPAANVTVTAALASSASISLSAHQATMHGQSRYWTTFFHPSLSYRLSAGARAFILKNNKALYLLGDGSVVPAGCAVVIMAEKADLSLTKLEGSVSVSTSGNILQGRDADTPVSSLVPSSQTVYVLSQDGAGNLGFFPFTGILPANRAYYIE